MFKMFFLALAILGVLSYCFALPIEYRIVNGSDATLGQIKYIVSVRWLNYHICGGSILDNTHVLTAAHCVENTPPGYLSIQYGVIERKVEPESSTVIRVSQILSNEYYIPGRGYKNDVAVLKLEVPIYFGEYAAAVQLPKINDPTPRNEMATLSGWGRIYTGGTRMLLLQVVTIKVYSDEECEEIYGLNGSFDRNYHVCAGVPEGGKGQCSGDSGGPLVVDGIQVGIVSWSVKPCAQKGYPGVFTRVSTQIEWIKQQLKS